MNPSSLNPSSLKHALRPLAAAVLALSLGACTLGPDYQRPELPVATEFKQAEGWKAAAPADVLGRGEWWRLYGDAELDALVARLNVDNQNLAAAEAGIGAARAQVVDAEAAVDAAQAAIEAIEVQIGDATLASPRDGRVQYRIAQEGEIVAAGGRILNLVDLEDVYMTFFLPTSQAGRVEVGAEARLVMDAVPQYVIPARISYVADVAQFTPKTVETEEERVKLMFRVRARIAPDLLQQHIEQVKTGLPGMAYVRVDPDASWPDFLKTNLTQ